MFDVADTNKNGVLEQEEFKQFTLFVLEAINGLSIADDEDDVGAMFARFDKNKDGILDWSEIWEAIKPLHAKLQ
jgi:Ca2+-binding EF-hand superfamily protein